MLFKHYFGYSFLLLRDIAKKFFYLFLSVGDPGLPRYIKLRAFGIFHELFFFFDNKNDYQCGCFFFFYTCIY